MASITGGIPLIGFVSPTDELDEYPVTNPKYGLGGLRTIGASAGLSLIPQQRREEGMIVFAEDEEKYYHLFGGTGDEHWTELKFDGEDGATGPTGPPVRFTFGQTFPEVEESRLGDYFLGASGSGDYEGGLFIFAPLDEDEGVTGTWWEISGVKGDDGDDGATGVQGFQGITGHQGFQGSTGADGFVGGTGPTGVQGFQGITGHQGFQGFSITGATGVQGFQGITGHQGFQGFSITGPTGVQGFQGHTGFQGFQGFTGPTGFQGFQGHTGFQGFQGTTGPAGSGKYFYGPTAPEDTAEGLTLGSKWFNTEVGGEFTYLSDPGNNPYWVMTNVFSATGPQGPLGGGTGNQGFQGTTGPAGKPGTNGNQGFQGPTGPSIIGAAGGTGFQGFQGHTGFQGVTGPTGVQGFQGHTGFQGFQGVTGPTGFQGFQGVTGPTGFQGFQGHTGAKGETGDGLFDTTYEPNTKTGNSINYSSVGNVSGDGRKILILADDGSLTFDYLRTFDIFDKFKISSFEYDNKTQTIEEIGSGTYNLNASFDLEYSPPISTVVFASINISGTDSPNFPASLSDPFETLDASSLTFAYPDYPDLTTQKTVTFTASVTSSTDETDTATNTIVFRRPNYYGATSGSNLSFTELNTYLSKNLDTNIGYSFELNQLENEFIYYSYPDNYGNASFIVNGLPGGFVSLGTGQHTNVNNHTSVYKLYRSSNPFGSTSNPSNLISIQVSKES